MELLSFLHFIIGCTYISDLKIEPYNTKAKMLLNTIRLNDFSLNQIIDAINYIYY